MRRIHLLFVSMLFLSNSAVSAQNVVTDSSFAVFSVIKLNVSTVQGTITGMTGKVVFAKSQLAQIHVCIDPETINSDNKNRDKHLKQSDYLDVKTYPNICFESNSISKTTAGYTARGTLKLHGISKEISIPLAVKKNVLYSVFTIDRYEFGIGKKGDDLISREIALTIKCMFLEQSK